MKKLRQYKVDIYRLGDGTHKFDFAFDDDFFSLFSSSLVNKGKGSCRAVVVKSTFVIRVTLHIAGMVELVCDRSLELYNHNVEFTQELIYKYGEEEKELGENMFAITNDTQEINIGKFIYEFISIKIPMKKLHPKFKNENDIDELIYSSDTAVMKEENMDPRWEFLKKLK